MVNIIFSDIFLPYNTEKVLGLIPVAFVGCPICQHHLVTILDTSVGMYNVQVCRSVGVKEVVEGLLPGVRGLKLRWSIYLIGEVQTKSSSYTFNMTALHMVSLQEEAVTWLTDLNDCSIALSPFDEN